MKHSPDESKSRRPPTPIDVLPAVGELAAAAAAGPVARKKAEVLQFPMKPHLLKYLQVHLPDDYSLSERDEFGGYLFHRLRHGLRDASKDKYMHQYTARFPIRLSRYPRQQYGLQGMNANTVFLFNKHVEKRFRAELFSWVEIMARRADVTIKDAILSFMEIYDLEETDIQFETLRKAVQREQKFSKKNAGKGKKSLARLSRKNHFLSLSKALDTCPLPLTVLIAQIRGTV